VFNVPPTRIAVITGAHGGLGRELAAAFARAGWGLGLIGHTKPDALDELAGSLEAAPTATACCDVRDAAAVEQVFGQFDAELGSVDALVNAAAISPPGLLATMEPEVFDRTIDVNVTGVFHCMRSAARRMLRQRDGHIINIGSYWGLHGLRGASAYSASKAALVGLTMAAARELGPKSIRCNVVLPGFMRTPMTGDVRDEDMPRIVAHHALGRTSDFDEVCGFIIDLAAMRHVSGQVFNLDSRPGRL
jgi:3-oxoacyl-[acyl-carrier protein] reductase